MMGGWNIMMFGYKHTFRVSWGLGQRVRGLGVGTRLGDLGLGGPGGTGP